MTSELRGERVLLRALRPPGVWQMWETINRRRGLGREAVALLTSTGCTERP